MMKWVRDLINGLSIQSLGRFSTAVIVLIVVIVLSVNLSFTNNVSKINNEWQSHSESTLKKSTYLGFIRKSLGYGGMIHHLKNYVLRGDQGNLIEAHFHILELRTYIAAYRNVGVSIEEEKIIGVIENGVNQYYAALSKAEKLKIAGFDIEQIDKAIQVNDAPSFEALLTLEGRLFAEGIEGQQNFSNNVEQLTRFSFLSTMLEGVAFVFFIIILGWIFRRRIVSLYAREVEEKKKIDEERIKIDTMVNSINEGLVTIDGKGIILSVNNALLKMYGYKKEQLIGKNVKILVPAPHYANHDEYLKSYLTTGQAKIIGATRELESIRANGQSFPIGLNVSEMEVSGERHFVGTISDVTARKAADRAKKQFIATVSHELRTPLTAIQGALGMVSTGVLGEVPNKIESLVNVALNNTKRLVVLVNDLLDLEKLDAGQMNFDYSEQTLAEIIGNAYYSNIPYADEYDVKLELTGKGRGLNVWADPKRIEQVITNLLSNAIKFSPKGGTVTINFEKHGDKARVEVIDQGSGIPDAFKDRIFKRFSQADSSDTRSKGGTGLGLSISKVIVENHNGAIDFTSSEGNGSVFYFELPLYKRKEVDKLELNQEYLDCNVLIVEDTNPQADMLSKQMGKYGFTPIAVNNIAQARNQMHSTPVDTIIVDLDQVSLVRSLDLVQNLRLSKSRERFPIIFVSKEIERFKTEAKSSRYDVNLWLSKPFVMGEFLTELDETLRSSKNIKPKVLLIDNDGGLSIRLKKHIEDNASLTVATSDVEAKLCYEHIAFDAYIIDPTALGENEKSISKEIYQKIKGSDVKVIYYSQAKVRSRFNKEDTVSLIKTDTSFENLIEVVNETLAKLGKN